MGRVNDDIPHKGDLVFWRRDKRDLAEDAAEEDEDREARILAHQQRVELEMRALGLVKNPVHGQQRKRKPMRDDLLKEIEKTYEDAQFNKKEVTPTVYVKHVGALLGEMRRLRAIAVDPTRCERMVRLSTGPERCCLDAGHRGKCLAAGGD